MTIYSRLTRLTRLIEKAKGEASDQTASKDLKRLTREEIRLLPSKFDHVSSHSFPSQEWSREYRMTDRPGLILTRMLLIFRRPAQIEMASSFNLFCRSQSSLSLCHSLLPFLVPRAPLLLPHSFQVLQQRPVPLHLSLLRFNSYSFPIQQRCHCTSPFPVIDAQGIS